ncbi:J domain-containing protein [Burkholderia guangdongensis]|uniref:J domain-containing protein n=1 Tax=Burkholderia guangdongensis TaxID=1792500 RepID=UPI0015C8110D|nr:DnaJ domain-containing protein [Burkholderia guangdongensis]
MTTLYEMLGVREDATDEEIKRGYRKAAMRAHPDRNVGSEASAHARFQEVKEAYAILSDPAQRRVYDTVYAEEMRRHAHLREEEERLQAERDAEYARLVALAMRFAEQGHNRDVVFGVLLGRDCDESLAGRIADSVTELHASRQQDACQDARSDDAVPEESDQDATHTASAQDDPAEADAMRQSAPEPHAKDEARTGNDRAQMDFFSTLWHGVFGLRH